jgi:CheY-like chemotaxis protein
VRSREINDMPASPPEPKSILLVDDHENETLLTKLRLQRTGLHLPIHSVPGGLEAIAYLNSDPPYQDRVRHPTPAVVLLDIQMPHMDGFEVLCWIRKQPNLSNLPVVMLTGSQTKTVAETARLLGATSVFVKSVNLANAAELAGCIRRLIGMMG